jgi:hypothetical protein
MLALCAMAGQGAKSAGISGVITDNSGASCPA